MCFKQTEFFELVFCAYKPSSMNSVCLKHLSLILACLKKHTLIISLSLSVSLSLSDSPQSQSLSHSRSHSLTLPRCHHRRRCRRSIAVAVSLTRLPQELQVKAAKDRVLSVAVAVSLTHLPSLSLTQHLPCFFLNTVCAFSLFFLILFFIIYFIFHLMVFESHKMKNMSSMIT